MTDSDSIKDLYFKDITGKKLLTKEQEHEAFVNMGKIRKQLEKLSDLKEYAEEDDTLSATKKIVKKNRLQRQYNFYRNQLIESQYLLIVKIAKRYRNRYLTLLDMIEEGNLALVSLIEKFDITRGLRFSTFVFPVVKNAILKSVLDKGNMIRTPAKNSYSVSSMSLGAYRGSNGERKLKPFSRNQVGIGVDSSKWLNVVGRYKVYSFDDPLGSNAQLTLGETLFDDSEGNDVEEAVIKDSMQVNLHKYIKKLSLEEKEIIIHYYGLNDIEPISFIKIGEKIGKSSERIRQIHNVAIEKLKVMFDLK